MRDIFEDVGFIYHSKVMIWKDPLIEVTRTKSLGLAHKQVVKDATRCRQGLPDYVITMAKPGVNPESVGRGRGFEEYIGEKNEPQVSKVDQAKLNKYSHFIWLRYASPVWMDIRQGNTLNIKMARDKRDERHICPLQLDVIARCLELWTNPGDTVASWFAGIGSEIYQALRMGRKGIGVELKDSYYSEMSRNLKSISFRKGFKI
jgi:DNA modification methylase